MAGTVLQLSVLIAAPALSWYCAMPLTAVTDITAIYNTFAFFAYLLAVLWLGEKPTRAKLGSVVVAVLGVFVIAYGDSWMRSNAPEDDGGDQGKTGTSRMIGNLLALFGAVSYAFYEVSCFFFSSPPTGYA
jgi:drug/metabolite transporter (DMT)-like permease